MEISTLPTTADPMGLAISQYYQTGKAGKLRVLSSMFDEDEIPVPHLFRTLADMPELEKQALHLSKGRILDIGAGAGCHSLSLQKEGKDVLAIDISPLSCQTMQQRGVKQVQCINLFDKRLTGQFDTLLMLMNGIGIVGKLKNMPDFFQRIRALLKTDGQLLLDSSDLKYLYENEDGTYDIDPLGSYYGEVDYQMVYRNVKGASFNWLYIDYDTLSLLAKNNGFLCEKIAEGEHYDYLARLIKK